MKCEYCDNELPINVSKCPSCGAGQQMPHSINSQEDRQENSSSKGADEKFCESCGQVIKKEAELCVKCGVRQNTSTSSVDSGAKSKLVAILLGLFVGALGAHNFYLGHTKKGIVQFLITVLTAGYGAFISGIWALSDVIEIGRGNIRDSAGNILQ